MKNIKYLLLLISIFCSICMAAGPQTKVTMVDPVIDQQGPFSYLAYPNNEMAMMSAPNGFQLTYEGAIFNRESELCLFYGNDLKPVMARQKTMQDGYIPIFHYSWNDGAVVFNAETFAGSLDGNPATPAVAFLKITLTNQGETTANAQLAAAIRHCAKDYRFNYKQETFNPDWIYKMDAQGVYRDGRFLLLTPPGAIQESVPGTAYKEPFSGRDFNITESSEVCLSRYPLTLKPGESTTLRFKFPYRGILETNLEEMTKLQFPNYNHYRSLTDKFWKDELAKGMQIKIPETKVNEAWKANLVYNFMAIWQTKDGTWVPGVNKFQYNWFWLRDGAYIVRTLDMYGYHSTAEKCLEYFPRFQQKDGNFSSAEGQFDGFGQALYALGEHYFMTGDTTYANKVYPHFPPAVEWLTQARQKDPLHLMPKTEAKDNELIIGHYTGHNFWALLGLRMAIRMAKATGHTQDAAAFQAEYDDFYQAFMKQLKKTSGTKRYIPPGLDTEGGQDWGNFIGVYPAEVLDPFDPRVTTSLDSVHKNKYQEGIMTYCGNLHQYVTVKVTQNHVFRNEQEQTLKDFYHILLHTGSAHEMFEWRAEPWGNRDVGDNYPPHGWGSAMLNALLRNMLIHEAGGNGGLGPRNLHLFSVLSPEWVKPGQKVEFKNAATDLGPVSASYIFDTTWALINISSQFREQPQSIILHIPYFMELDRYRYTTNAKSTREENGCLVLSPDVTYVRLYWKKKPGTKDLSFNSVLEDYKQEYARRYKEYLKEGNQPKPITAPAFMTPEQRSAEFKAKYHK